MSWLKKNRDDGPAFRFTPRWVGEVYSLFVVQNQEAQYAIYSYFRSPAPPRLPYCARDQERLALHRTAGSSQPGDLCHRRPRIRIAPNKLPGAGKGSGAGGWVQETALRPISWVFWRDTVTTSGYALVCRHDADGWSRLL